MKCFYVPQFRKNFISLSKLLNNNPTIIVSFSSSSCYLKDRLTKKILHYFSSSNSLFTFSIGFFSPQALASTKISAGTWHARLEHPSSTTTLHVINSSSLPCLSSKLINYHNCSVAKAHKLSFTASISTSTTPLDVIHSDVWGTSPICSNNGFRYYIIFVDDFSRYTWIYFTSQKSEVSKCFSLFKNNVETLFNSNIKILRTDGGGEYKPIFHNFPQITQQLSYPYTPQQNRVAERKHHHIVKFNNIISKSNP
jgi:Integrase core domain